MTRPLRIEFPGAVYHVTSRGNAKQIIFLDDKDRRNFLIILSLTVKRFNLICHAYCLMDNHYHLLIETPEGNLSKGMKQLNSVYAQKFNWKNDIAGHLFQGRYKAILIEKENYLLTLCRYIVLNPVKAGLVKQPQEWRWSSYCSTAGEIEKPSFLTIDWILSQFEITKNKAMAMEKYVQFILNGIGTEFQWNALKGQILLGNDDFVQKLSVFLKDKDKIKEVSRMKRYATRPKLTEIFAGNKIRDKKTRNQATYLASMHYGYSFKEIAECLNLHYTTISRVVREIEKKYDKM